MKRRMKVDLDELELAFEDATGQVDYYLEFATGRVVAVTPDLPAELTSVNTQLYENGIDGTVSFAEGVERLGLPEWQRKQVEATFEAVIDDGTEYVMVPPPHPGDGYKCMREFLGTVDHDLLRLRLEDAIRGRGAYRRFKDVLRLYEDEWQRWHEFRSAMVRWRILEWLDEEGIEHIGGDEELGIGH